ncbi:GNAT family N-acetyltransferase [Brachybacterium ginsengisoli]|uniref:GNAT family N-acetyltransferase n=1 Tax=Brachybacterium ginsengisoli TaxID=1331682 RepID=UPI001474412F|nr:GNAT family N-acetyltransferase [Brachybacterium ginsengisoli]
MIAVHDQLSETLVRLWVDGWARTRGHEAVHEGGMHTVGPRDGDAGSETILYRWSEDELRRASASVTDAPHHLLTLISAVDETPPDLESCGDLDLISDQERLMVTDMALQDVENPITPDSCTVARESFDRWTLLSVIQEGRVVARGRMAIVDSCAVLDRIYTASSHRRQGLGTYVTRALLAIAHEQDVETGLLMATGRGVDLYENLGWTPLADVRVLGAAGARNRRRPSHAQIDEELG